MTGARPSWNLFEQVDLSRAFVRWCMNGKDEQLQRSNVIALNKITSVQMKRKKSFYFTYLFHYNNKTVWYFDLILSSH